MPSIVKPIMATALCALALIPITAPTGLAAPSGHALPGAVRARVALRGSERLALPGAHAVALADPAERLRVSVWLRPRASLEAYVKAMGASLPRDRRYLTHEELAEAFGADPADVRRVEAFAAEHGLKVIMSDARRGLVELEGTVAVFDDAFGVSLKRYEYPGGAYRGHEGSLSVPVELARIVSCVAGLDNRPVGEPRLRRRAAAARASADAAFWAPEVASQYHFPAGVDGQGQCIGIIEFGGGYSDQDLADYFTGLGLTRPQVTAVSVDGAQNRPGKDDLADGEVALDIEVAGAVAPGARIVVYFAPWSEKGWLDALDAAIQDTQNNPSAISISWGWPEHYRLWTTAVMQHVDLQFQKLAAMGVTVAVASGDDGRFDDLSDKKNHVDFPASSPFVLACGGTEFLVSDTNEITGEVVWDDGRRAKGGATGGGMSSLFPRPDWQAQQTPSGGRGVPDVAGDASGSTGYYVEVGGQLSVSGGTSAVAPLWAGLVALMNQSLGQRVGYLNPLIYALSPGAGAFHDIIAGGGQFAFPAGPGWDAATGLGSPDGARLLQALSGKGG